MPEGPLAPTEAALGEGPLAIDKGFFVIPGDCLGLGEPLLAGSWVLDAGLGDEVVDDFLPVGICDRPEAGDWVRDPGADAEVALPGAFFPLPEP